MHFHEVEIISDLYEYDEDLCVAKIDGIYSFFDVKTVEIAAIKQKNPKD